MTSPAPRLSLRSPADLVTTLPLLLGFHPERSLVAVSLRGPRGRVGLVMRADLPSGITDLSPVYVDLASRMAADGAAAVLVVFYPGISPGGRPREVGERLLEGLHLALRAQGLLLRDALVVAGGRWWSLECADEACCPAEGTPVVDASDPGASDGIAAAAALGGLAALPDRGSLVASLAPLPLLEAARMQAVLVDVGARRLDRSMGAGELRAADLERWRAAVTEATESEVAMADPAAAELILSADDVGVRDEVITWATGSRGEPLERLLRWLVVRAIPPQDAAVCSMLAWLAYQRGDGAVARVALDRARRTDPDYSLAGLLETALQAGVPPAQLRRASLLMRRRPAPRRRRRSAR